MINEEVLENIVKKYDTGWKEVTLNSGFTSGTLPSSGKLMIRRINNVVYIKGSVSGFTALGSQTCAIIPTGFRPTTRICLFAEYSGSRPANFFISSAGNIQLCYNDRGSTTSDYWYNICGSWIINDTFPS